MQIFLQHYYKFLKNITPDPFLIAFHMLLYFVGILRETQKFIFKDGNLKSTITILMLSFNSVFLVTKMIYSRVSVTDFANKASLVPIPSPSSPEFADLTTTLMDYVQLFAGLEWNLMFAFSLTSLFFATASILASAVTYREKDLSIKELLSRARKPLKISLVTWFYITLLDLGYWLFAIACMIPSALIFNPKFTITVFFIIIHITAVFFQSYLNLVWTIALILSVLEEKCGTEVLGKAGQLIKGSKQGGFVLKLFGAFSMWVSLGFAKICTRALPANAVMLPPLLVTLIFCLINIFLLMAYTVLYYECKEIHGENLEMQGSTEYTKATFTPLTADAV